MERLMDALEIASCTNPGAMLDSNRKSKADTSGAAVEFESLCPSETGKDEEVEAQPVAEDLNQNDEKEIAQAQHIICQS